MPIDPAYFVARAREERNRYLAYIDPAPDLELPLLGGRFVPMPVVTLRWRHVVALLRSGNALLTPLPMQPGDFAEVLWLLHPWHPDNRHLARARPLALPLYAWLSRLVVLVICRQLVLPMAEQVLRQRRADAFQDRETPPENDSDEGSNLMPTLTQLDDVSRHFASAGYTREQILGAGVAWTLQVIRAEGLRAGRIDDFVPPSARLYRNVKNMT